MNLLSPLAGPARRVGEQQYVPRSGERGRGEGTAVRRRDLPIGRGPADGETALEPDRSDRGLELLDACAQPRLRSG